MADTRFRLKVEKWVRDKWMREKFRRQFCPKKLFLAPGGEFEFDAVSKGRKIVACISTARGKTAKGKNSPGNLRKIQSDILFLLLAKEPKKRVVILTEKDMYDVCLKEKKNGRVPCNIEFKLATISPKLRTKLKAEGEISSREMSPG